MNFDRYPSRCAPPTVHRGPDPSSPRRLKSAFQGAMRRASAFADAKDNPPVGAGRPPAEGLRADGNRPSKALRAKRRPSPTQATFLGRRRPTVGRRPPCRWKSAFQGAARQASAFADAKDTFPVGAGRPLAEGPPRPNSFGAQADHRPKAFVPIEIGPSRRCTPSVGLRRRKRQFSGRRRPTVGRRPPCRLKSAFQGAARQASAFADASDVPRSAQADRRPKAPPGRIHSACRPTVGRRPPRPNSFGMQADRRPKAFVPIKIGLPRRCTPSVGLRRRKRQFSGRRRPTVGRRPPQAEFIRHAGRPSAEGLRAD